MESESEDYKLSATILGHSMDVRGVSTGVTVEGKEFIVSCSREKTTKVWVSAGDGNYDAVQYCEGHTSYVSCVCVIPPCGAYPMGLILTGGHDKMILGFEVGASNRTPSFKLSGHEGTVCSIAYTTGSDLLFISGSWDCTAKVWRKETPIATLTGHEQAVWAVATIPENNHLILTGSADKKIRLWNKRETRTIFTGHKDCVRDLVIVDGDRFLSCSNDATIIMWELASGKALREFEGHTNYIYKLSILPNGEGFASVGEDRSLRIWKAASESVQVIYLPALSVWSVATMKNGDLITGSSDGRVRIFTRDPQRVASVAALQQFDESVAQSSISAEQEIGGMKISQLPGTEGLLRAGKKDGDTKMIREGSKVVCYSWSEGQGIWTKIGDVVGGTGATSNSSGKVPYEGQEYDYVFNVELDDNLTLKLPFNITEDPWFAAQKFIHKNNLDQIHLDQVANFIINNTKGMELGISNTEYVDPFTGGSRYVPGSNKSTEETTAQSGNNAAVNFDISDLDSNYSMNGLTGQVVDPKYFAVNGVFFTCPIIGPKIGTRAEIEKSIDEFLLDQVNEDIGVTSCLLIHSCNGERDRVQIGVDTLCKILDNIIKNPNDPKFRKIRCSNKVFKEKVANLKGVTEFLQVAGFTKALMKPDVTPESSEEEFWVYEPSLETELVALSELRNTLQSTTPIRPELDRNVQVLMKAEVVSRKELPVDFYQLTGEELKKEQRIRSEIARLRSKTQREQDELREQKVYKFCLMRIRFPDGFTLQGTFYALEKVGDVYAFVQENLSIEDVKFSLKKSSGELLSDLEATLAEMRLAPATILNFNLEKELPVVKTSDFSFLRPELLALVQKKV